jgi:hypothetical protein
MQFNYTPEVVLPFALAALSCPTATKALRPISLRTLSFKFCEFVKLKLKRTTSSILTEPNAKTSELCKYEFKS